MKAENKVFKGFLNKLRNKFVAKAEEPVINTVVASGKVDAGMSKNIADTHVRKVYSKEIMFHAMPIMRFLQFAKHKTELGVQPGLSISMMTYNNLKRGGKLDEGTRIKTQTLSSSFREIRVSERGNAISVSELTLKTSFTDVMEDATILLGRDVALVLDVELRDTVLNGSTSTIYGRKDKNAPKVASRAEITESNVLSTASIKDAVEILATKNAPKFDGNYYVCFVHPHQSRDLRDDTAWVEASKYGAPEQLFNGEIGRIDDVRFIETTLMTNGVAGTEDDAYDAELVKGTGENQVGIYKSVVFGEGAYGYAVALPVELRDNGITDFGREHALAWYAIWGTGMLSEDRSVVIETA